MLLFTLSLKYYQSNCMLMLKSKHKHMVFFLLVCFCSFLHKLASNMPGKNWAVTWKSLLDCNETYTAEFGIPRTFTLTKSGFFALHKKVPI